MTDDERPRPWSVRASRVVLEDDWIRLRADDCVTSEGVTVSPFYVLDYPDWVHVVALDAEDHVVLVEQYRHGAARITLELPAGAVDPQDADLIRAAERELREETGYVSTDFRHVARLSPNPATHSNGCEIVLARNAAPLGRPLDDPQERIRVVRMPLGEAVNLAFSGRFFAAMHVAALLLAAKAAGKL